jgi:predicted amidohydrolase
MADKFDVVVKGGHVLDVFQGLDGPSDVGELTDLRYADVESAVKACEQYRDSIVGIKIRMTKNLVGDNGREGLKRARAV